MERSGYTFGNVAGSSAGAIIASLLAAGYTGEEIYEEMKRVNYFKFKEKHLLDYFGIVGKLLSILFHFGIYSADYFEQWLTELLSRKGVYTFGDLKCVLPSPSSSAFSFISSANDSSLPATCSAIATAASFPELSIKP